MKKILFNSEFGLEQAVLDGRKTMIRMAISPKAWQKYCEYDKGYQEARQNLVDGLMDSTEYLISLSPYKVGEVVAVAQRYKDVHSACKPNDVRYRHYCTAYSVGVLEATNGWNNKMFVCADYMPHHIKITDIKVERLQEIRDSNCLLEGIYPIKSEEVPQINETGAIYYTFDGVTGVWTTIRKAFAALIDKVRGKGTWASNPWCFAYGFELVD